MLSSEPSSTAKMCVRLRAVKALLWWNCADTHAGLSFRYPPMLFGLWIGLFIIVAWLSSLISYNIIKYFIRAISCSTVLSSHSENAYKHAYQSNSFIAYANGVFYVSWGVGLESARFHGIVNDESLWNIFCCLLCIVYCRTTPILKTLGQFENLVFVIMSTGENIR